MAYAINFLAIVPYGGLLPFATFFKYNPSVLDARSGE